MPDNDLFQMLIEAYNNYDTKAVEELLSKIDAQALVLDPEIVEKVANIRTWYNEIKKGEELSQKYGHLIKELMNFLDEGRLKEAVNIRESLSKIKKIPLPQMLEIRYNQLIALNEHKKTRRKLFALIGATLLILFTLSLSVYFVHQYKTDKKEKVALELLKKQINKNNLEVAQINLELLIKKRPEFLENETFLNFQKKIKKKLYTEYQKQDSLTVVLEKILHDLKGSKDSTLAEKEFYVKNYYYQMITIKKQINQLVTDTQHLMILLNASEKCLINRYTECDKETFNKLKITIIELNELISTIYTYNFKDEKSLKKAKENYQNAVIKLEMLKHNRFSKIVIYELQLEHLQTAFVKLEEALNQAQELANLKQMLPQIKNYVDYKKLIKQHVTNKEHLQQKIKMYNEIALFGEIGKSIKNLKQTNLLTWALNKGFSTTWQVSFERAKALCHYDELAHRDTLENIKNLRNEWGNEVFEILLTDSLGGKTHLYTQKTPRFLKNTQGKIVLCWIDVFISSQEIQKVILNFDAIKNEWVLNTNSTSKRFVNTNLADVEKGQSLAPFIVYADSFLTEYTQTEPDERLMFLSAQWDKLKQIKNLDEVWRHKIAYEILHLASNVYSYDRNEFKQLMNDFKVDSKFEELHFKEICMRQQAFRNGAIYIELLHIVPSGFLIKNGNGLFTLYPFDLDEIMEYWSIERDEFGMYIFEKVADNLEPIMFLPSAYPQLYDCQLLWSPLGYDTDSVRKLSYPQKPALWPRNVTWP